MTSRSNSPPASEAGFTLLEMIVVIAVMGLALALVAGYGKPRSHTLEARIAAREVAQAMRAARGEAITRGHPVALALPPLPAWLAIQAPPGGIVFAPDGSSSGGTVWLAADGRKFAVTADWLTGKVDLDAP